METPTVTTTTTSTPSNGAEKRRQNNADYLQIDPSSTFINNTNRNGGFEELPENFLDTISPHQPSSGSGPLTVDSPRMTPQLAPLAPMSITNEHPSSSSGYSGLLTTSYSHVEKTFGNSTASLLSPLHVDRRQQGSHDFGSSGYIKEEVDLDGGNHLLMSSINQQQQELERDTPPAVSNVELASTMIASLIGGTEGHGLRNDDSPSPRNYGEQSGMLQPQMIKDESDDDPTNLNFSKAVYKRNGEHAELDFHAKHYGRGTGIMNQASSSQSPTPAMTVQRRIYSTQDSSDPLNAEIEDDIYIDTKDLCKRIAFELKQHSIPQAIFAERILCRSQGTLSDLLRNPKPWNKLKSGRETFRRMYNWVRQPLETRLAILDMKSEGDELSRVSGMSPPTPAQNVRQPRKSTAEDAPISKRPRLVFTDIQKRTLQAIFKETQRPSREMQQTIAEHLRLDLSTVANFFMNARRRSRIGPNSDEPAPYQQIRSITPPPEASPNALHSNGDDLMGHQQIIDQMMYKDDDVINDGVADDDNVYQLEEVTSSGGPTEGAILESNRTTPAPTNEHSEKVTASGNDITDMIVQKSISPGAGDQVIKEETPDDGDYERKVKV